MFFSKRDGRILYVISHVNRMYGSYCYRVTWFKGMLNNTFKSVCCPSINFIIFITSSTFIELAICWFFTCSGLFTVNSRYAKNISNATINYCLLTIAVGPVVRLQLQHWVLQYREVILHQDASETFHFVALSLKYLHTPNCTKHKSLVFYD